MKYLVKMVLIALLTTPLAVNAKVMSYIFEGEVTSSFRSSIIADTNIDLPAIISGKVVYDTDANGASSALGSIFKLISVELVITSQTDVELTLSSNDAFIAMRLFGVGIFIPTIDITESSSINTNWGGGGLGNNYLSYNGDSIKMIFVPQTDSLLPTEAEVLSPNPINGGIEFVINGASIKGKMTSLEIVEGNKSKAKSASSSSDDSSSGGSLSPLVFAFMMMFFAALLIRRNYRA